MGAHREHRPVLLIAAGSRHHAAKVAERRGLGPLDWMLLTYESHRAFPDVDLWVDPSWSNHRNAEAIQAMIGVRARQ